ncbi:MAG: DUF11 domain-containing protein, partial [Betaproteobacteria bacterium]|nr:DUF11 domain-containing protein [Betaproteobacteria bacterium]
TQASLTKAFTPATIAQGGTSTLTFTLANGAGNPAQSGINFTDTLPANVVIAATPNVTSSCPSGTGVVTATAGTGVITVTGATMNAAQASCTVTVDVTSNTAGTYNNTNAGNISATQRVDTTGVNATLAVQALPTLTKAFSPATVGVNQASTLTFTITNPAGAPARSGLTFTDTLPAGLAIASPNGVVNGCGGTPTITATSGTGVFTVGGTGVNAAVGASTCTVTVNVTSTTAGSYVNGAAQVTAIGGMLNGVTNQTLTVTQAALTKAFAPATINQGGTSTLTFTLTNGAGNPAQAGINFTDTLPANVVIAGTPNVTSSCPSGTGVVTATAGAGTITVTGATMSAAQASCTVTVDVTSNTAGSYTNTNAGNIGGTANVTTTGVSSTLTVQALPVLTKAFATASLGLGQTTTLTFTITNTAGGSVNRTGLAFTDTLPAGLTIANPPVPATNGQCGTPAFTAVNATQPFTASSVDVNAGQTCTITLTVTGSTLGAKVNGAAQITAITGMTNGVTNQTVTVVQPALTKAFAPATIAQGGTSTLTFTLTNGAGNPAQSGINFTDTLPANVVIAATPNVTSSCPSGTGVVTATAGTGVITVTGATMNAAQASCTVTVDVTSNTAGTYNNTNAGNISLTQRVDTTGVNSTLTVQALPSLTKAFSPSTVGVGQASVLTFTITNPAGAPARSGLTFTDTLPAGLAIATPNGVADTCSGTPTITATPGTGVFTVGGTGVNAGAGASSCTVTVNVTSTTAGAYVNGAAQITAIGGMLNGVTNQTLTVTQASLTKAFAPATIAQGGISTLTFTLANGVGNPAQSGINFTDTLPANVVIAGAPNVTSSCPSGTGVVTATAGTGVITVTGATMSAAQASCTVTVDVTSNTAGTYTNTNAGNISGAANLTTTGVNATLTVQALPTLTKAFSPSTVGVNQASTLTFTITNPAGAPARSGLTFTDTLPAGLVIASPNGVVNGCGGTPTITATSGTGVFTVGGTGVNAAIGASTCTVTVNVTSTTAGAYVNGAAQVTAIGGMLNGVTNQTLTVTQASLTKAFAPATIAQGGTSTLTFTLANGAGNPAQSGINFTDTLPANVVIAATPNVTSSCPSGTGVVTATAGTGVITVTGATMNAAQASCTVTVDVTSNTTGTYNNTNAGNISATQRVDTAGVNATLTVQALPTLTKAFSPSTVGVNQASTLTFTITNPAGAPARSGLTFTDTLPAGLSVATPNGLVNGCGGTPAITATPGSGVFTVGGSGVSAAVGASTCTVTVNVTSTTAGSYVNGAAQITAIGGMLNGVTNQTLTVAQASLTKAFAPATINQGATSTLTFTLTNGAGNPAQSGINFTDTLPANVVIAATPNVTSSCPSGTGVVSAAAGSGTITVTGATMNAAQASCTVTVDVTSNTAGTYNNTNAGNISGAANLTTTGVNATLTVQSLPTLTKAFSPSTVGVGQNSTLTFTITNPAGAPARSGLTFTDTLPAGAVIGTPNGLASTCGGTPTVTAAPGSGVFTVGGTGVNAAAGASTCTISVNVTSGTAGSYVNGAAQVSAIGGMLNGVTNQTLTVTQASLAKAFAPATISQGGTSTLTFTLANGAGNPAQSGINFTDTLPANVVIAATPNVTSSCPSGTGVVTAAAGSGVITVTGAAMSAAQTSCTVTVDVTSNTAGTYNNTNAANISATANVTTTGVNATLTVQALPSLTKAFSPSTVGVGQASVLTFTITNPAGAPARSGLTFTDTLPAGLAIAAPNGLVNGCGGAPTITATAGTGVFTVGGTGVNAAAGASTCTIAVNVTSATAGSYVNGAAQVTALSGMTNGVTNQTLSVVQPALTKAFAPVTISQGGVSTLTFTLANGAGNPAQSGINFTDTLPANVVIAATPNVTSSCPSGTGVVTAAAGSGVITVTGATMNAAQASCTVTVDVTSSIAGVYANTNAVNLSATRRVDTAGVNATLTVQALPTLTKAFAPASVGVNQNSVLTFTITNPAGAPARSGLTFTDTLPAGLVIGTPAGVANGCGGTPTITATPGTGVFTVGGSGVNAGAGASSCTLSVNVASASAGSYVNGAAQVTAIGGMLNGVTNQTLTVLSRPTVAKAFGVASMASGGTTTLTVTLSNANAAPLTGVAFTDVFPVAPGAMTLANVTATNTCGGALADSGGGVLNAGDAGIQLSGGTIPAGSSCAVTVNVTAAAPGTYTNTLAAGSVSSANAGSNAAPASASLQVSASPTIAKAFAPATIAADATSTITFTLANPNGIALTAAGFTDTLSGMSIAANGAAGGTCAGAAGNTFTAGQTALSFTGLTIPAGGSCTVTVVVTSDVPGAHGNQASGVSSAEAVTGAASNIATLTVNAAAPTIAKAFAPATINADGTSTVTLTLANPNGVALTTAGCPAAPTNMAISAAGAAGGTCAGAAGNAFAAGQTALTISNLTVPANGSCTVTFVVTSDRPGTHNNATSGVSSAQAPIGPVSNTATLTVNAAAPTIAKAFSPSTIAAGATSTVTVTLSNTLGVPLTGGAFSDTLSGMAIASTGPAGGTCAGASSNGFTAGATALSFSGLTVPANGSCTVTVVVASNLPGTHNNTTSAFTSVEAPASAVSNTATLTVTATAPTIAKAFSPAAITSDQASTITFTITNPLGTPLTAAGFTDTLANMAVATSGAAGGTCAGAAGNFLTAGQTAVAITGLTVPAAGSCTVTVVVTSDIPGVHVNQASGVSSTEAPLGAPSNSTTLTVTAAPATIAKAFFPAGIPVNSTSTITFTLANANGIPLTAAAFTDTLANMQVNAAGPAGGTCAGAAGNSFTAGQTALSVSNLTIPANGSCTVTVVVLGNVIGTQPNQASGVSSAEAATGAASNVANLTVQPLPPTIAKQFTPASIMSGGTTTLLVTIGNPNPIAITVTSVTDTYPAGMATAGTPAASTTCAGGAVSSTAGSATLTGGTVTAGGSCTFQINVTAPTQGVYANTIPVGALTTSGGFNTVAASATLTVDPVADLAVVKTAPASIGTGQPLSYTVSVVNNGPDAANGAQFADTVPAQVTGVSAVCGAVTGGAVCGTVSVAGNSVTSTVTTLPAGGSVTFTINGTATGLGAITNTATVAAPAGVLDPTPANNSSSAPTTILAPDITVAKTHAGNFTAGSNGVYTITVSNGAGSLPTSGVITVVDNLPAGLSYVSGTGTGWSCAAAGQVVTCTTSGAIAAGASAPAITLTVAVASTAIPSVLNAVTVSGGGEPAAAAGNNTASDNTIVVAAATNAFAPDGAQTGVPGSVVFYPHTFNAGSAGNVAFATSAIATPAVPGWSQAIYRDTNCNGTLDGTEGAAPLSGSVAVAAGGSVCIIVRDSIPGAAPYNAQNVITVTATFNGTQNYTRTDTTTVGAAGGAGLTLAKTVRNVTQGGTAGTTGTALPNDILEYTITYTNTSAGTVSAIVITDATPAFTLYQSAACGALPGNVTGCSVTTQPAVNGTGSVVWTLTGTLLSGGSGSVTYQVRLSP